MPLQLRTELLTLSHPPPLQTRRLEQHASVSPGAPWPGHAPEIEDRDTDRRLSGPQLVFSAL